MSNSREAVGAAPSAPALSWVGQTRSRLKPRWAALARRRGAAFEGVFLVSAATMMSGVLIYAFHVIAARALGADGYGRIALLWAALFLVVVVIYRPLEQTLSRSLADRASRGEDGYRVVAHVTGLAAVVTLAIAAILVLAWQPITARLFDGHNALTSLLLAGIVVYGAAYVIRGILGGVRWFAGYAAALTADSLVRLAIAAPLLIFASEELAGSAMVLAGAAAIVVPLAFGRLARRLPTGSAAVSFDLRAALRFAGPASGIAAADQVLVNGGPLIVAIAGISGGSKAAGIAFAATMLVRVPVFLFQGFAASLLPNLTRLHATATAEFRAATRQTATVFVSVGATAVVGTLAFGPEALRLVFGPDFDAGRGPLTLLAAGVGLYLAAATLSQALLAEARAARAAAAWLAGGTTFVILVLLVPGSPLLKIAVAFVASTSLVLAGVMRVARTVAVRTA